MRNPMTDTTTSEPTMGVLTAHVYSVGDRLIYLAHAGAHEELCLDAEIVPGGDWCESNVVFEDASPKPPMLDGLWHLKWAWRDATDDEFNSLLCCHYIGQPAWHLACAPLVQGET